MKATYDPAAVFELKVCEVELRRTEGGRPLMARVYQPQGAGPFPTVLDLHGGAWRRKDRLAEEPMDRAIAASGVLVVAIVSVAGHRSQPAEDTHDPVRVLSQPRGPRRPRHGRWQRHRRLDRRAPLCPARSGCLR